MCVCYKNKENHFIDPKKINRFNTIKNTAGKTIKILSFNFNLTSKPQSMSRLSPKDEIVKNMSNFKPINNPEAPVNSKTIVNNPNFSKLNRLNSFFI